MKSKYITLLLLGIIGFIASYFLFMEWLVQNNFDFLGGWREAFAATGFSPGLQVDLTFCAFIVLAATLYNRKKLGLKWVSGIFISTIFLGACLGLALYLVGAEIKNELPTHS